MENGVDEPSLPWYCQVCGERCEEPQPGEIAVCDDEECRKIVWRTLHPEDAYL